MKIEKIYDIVNIALLIKEGHISIEHAFHKADEGELETYSVKKAVDLAQDFSKSTLEKVLLYKEDFGSFIEWCSESLH